MSVGNFGLFELKIAKVNRKEKERVIFNILGRCLKLFCNCDKNRFKLELMYGLVSYRFRRFVRINLP